MRRCNLCVKFKTHCWPRTCGPQAMVRGGKGELKRIKLHLRRVSASPTLLVAIIVVNMRQTKYSETKRRRWPTATATPSLPSFLPPPPGSVSTHLARFVGERDMYMRNYIVDFPGGSSSCGWRGREGGRKEQVQPACGTLFSCSTALLRFWPGHCGGFFLFDFLFVFFFRFRFAPLANAAGAHRLGLALGIIYYAWLQVCMYVCVWRHAPTPTSGWMHNSYFRVARLVAALPFSPFWHFSYAFFLPYPFGLNILIHWLSL